MRSIVALSAVVSRAGRRPTALLAALFALLGALLRRFPRPDRDPERTAG